MLLQANVLLLLLESIGSVYEQSYKCKLDPKFFDKVNSELKTVSDYFKTPHSQSLFIAVIFLNFKGSSTNVKELTNYFDGNLVKPLECSDDLECLNSDGILASRKHQLSCYAQYKVIRTDFVQSNN